MNLNFTFSATKEFIDTLNEENLKKDLMLERQIINDRLIKHLKILYSRITKLTGENHKCIMIGIKLNSELLALLERVRVNLSGSNNQQNIDSFANLKMKIENVKLEGAAASARANLLNKVTIALLDIYKKEYDQYLWAKNVSDGLCKQTLIFNQAI